MVNVVPIELETTFAEGTVNAFLVMGDTISLVDTGNPGKESYEQFKNKLQEHGVQLSDIDQIVLTHIHVDHAGGIPYIQQEIDVPIYVHEWAQGPLNAGRDDFEKAQQFFHEFIAGCGADFNEHIVRRRYRKEHWNNVVYLTEGDTVRLGGAEFETVHVPGHSQTDILLWNRESGIAFAGDHLIKAFSVNAFIEPPDPGEEHRPKPLLQYRDSLKKVRQLPLTTIYPGHGEVFSNHVALVDKRLQEQEKRCNAILHILAGGAKTVFEISRQMYPHLHDRAVFLGLSQIQGHLDLLEQRHQVRFEKQGPIVYYYAI
ncbi:MBL fold metallo-hydrolase [Neobacillus sp. Marseille-QA0830]